MTKYVLHGGVTKRFTEGNEEFFRLLAESIPENGLYVACNFARTGADVQQDVYERDLAMLKTQTHGKTFRAELATKETLPKLLEECDVFYMTGGRMTKLQPELLTACPDIVERLKNVPVVAGSSAGACVLCRDYINDNPDNPSEGGIINEGLGIIPFGAVVHYHCKEGFEHQNDLSKRKKPLLMIPEAQFVVVEL